MSKRVLILGDSPLLKTGFGRVNLIAAKRFQSEGWEVASVAGLTREPPPFDEREGIRIFTPTRGASGDQLGLADIPTAIKEFKPDCIYMTAEAGTVTFIAQATPEMPALIYSPVEGGPMPNLDWQGFYKAIPSFTTSQYGVDVVKQETGMEIPYVYHGVDHDVFQKYDGMYEAVRKAIGWEDKFVINMTATNVRRKQHVRLMEAVATLIHKYKQRDIVLYLHTLPFNNYWLDGWNLTEIARSYGIEDYVFFHPKMTKRGEYVDEMTGEANNPGLVEMYNASDLFVLPSQVEGFGLPIAEAMACGVPVAVTQYAAGWEVASPAGKGLPVRDWEIHKSGTRYANVDVEKMAQLILKLKRNPKERERMSKMGLERAKDFDWDVFRERLVPMIEDSIHAYETSRPKKEEENQGSVPVQEEEVDLREVEAAPVTTESDNLSEGQGEDIDNEEATYQSWPKS